MKIIQTLIISTILYLLIPSVLFLLTWIHLWIGIPCVLFIVFYTWKTIQESEYSKNETFISLQNILLCLIISIALNYVLGIGEFRPQTYDFQANNFKYYDLITHNYPFITPNKRHMYVIIRVIIYLLPYYQKSLALKLAAIFHSYGVF